MSQFQPYIVAGIIVLLFFFVLPIVFGGTDKKRQKARTRCNQIVADKGGTLVSLSEEYRAMTREYDYNIEWEDSDGQRHRFRYHPAYPLSRESITEI